MADPVEVLESIEHLLMLIVRERIGNQTWLYDDALQEARIRAWERLEQGHSRGIATYAARQAVIDVVRGNRMTGSKIPGGIVDTHRHSSSIFKEGAEGEYVYEPADHRAQAELDRIDALDALRDPLAALPDRDRALVLATHFEGATQAELAEEHGISRQAIAQRLKKSYATLRELLAA